MWNFYITQIRNEKSFNLFGTIELKLRLYAIHAHGKFFRGMPGFLGKFRGGDFGSEAEIFGVNCCGFFGVFEAFWAYLVGQNFQISQQGVKAFFISQKGVKPLNFLQGVPPLNVQGMPKSSWKSGGLLFGVTLLLHFCHSFFQILTERNCFSKKNYLLIFFAKLNPLLVFLRLSESSWWIKISKKFRRG